MTETIELGDMVVDVIQKDIKNIHLSVHPPTGRVRISAPSRMSLDTIRIFAISKLGWIKKRQRSLREQERETLREYLPRESHFVWGKRYLLEISEGDQRPFVDLKHSQIFLRVRPGTDAKRRQAIMEEWYREQIKKAAPPLIARWEAVIGVKVARFYVRRMRTKWGSCNPMRRSIRLNTDLAKKPRECLEYIVVHEMVHFLARTHNARFIDLMDQLMPRWQFHRDQLNRLPVSHHDWIY